jgi:CHAT domain-containing protein
LCCIVVEDGCGIGVLRAQRSFTDLQELSKKKWETRYGALVIASKDEPSWIPLGAAPAIEKNAELYRKSVRGDTDETMLRLVLRTLHDQVWAPIKNALPAGAKTIILSPDGELNFISFATLLTAADEFLVEKYSIGYVASGRDLLREREASATELLAVFGNPDILKARQD